jgi:hypothetical protein
VDAVIEPCKRRWSSRKPITLVLRLCGTVPDCGSDSDGSDLQWPLGDGGRADAAARAAARGDGDPDTRATYGDVVTHTNDGDSTAADAGVCCGGERMTPFDRLYRRASGDAENEPPTPPAGDAESAAKAGSKPF